MIPATRPAIANRMATMSATIGTESRAHIAAVRIPTAIAPAIINPRNTPKCWTSRTTAAMTTRIPTACRAISASLIPPIDPTKSAIFAGSPTTQPEKSDSAVVTFPMIPGMYVSAVRPPCPM